MFEVVGANLRGVTLRQKGETDAALDLFVPWERITFDSLERHALAFDEEGDPLRHDGRTAYLSQTLGNGDVEWAKRAQALCIRRKMRDGTLRLVINRRTSLRASIGFDNAIALVLGFCFAGVLGVSVYAATRTFHGFFDVLYVIYGLAVNVVFGGAFFGWTYLTWGSRSSREPVRLEMVGDTIQFLTRSGRLFELSPAQCRPSRNRRGFVQLHDAVGTRVHFTPLDARERSIVDAFARTAGLARKPKTSDAPLSEWKWVLILQGTALLMSGLLWIELLEHLVGRSPGLHDPVLLLAMVLVCHGTYAFIWYIASSEHRTATRRHGRYGQRLLDASKAHRPEAAGP